ncbi:MAG: trigger factor [Treponema sp.]|nr:trigger factor [Treponema sp.]
MSKEITQLEKSSVKMSVTIPKEDAQAQYHNLLKEYAKNAQLPGFRKGKVPQELLVRKFGDALKGEALNKILEKAIEEVFQDENLSRHERPLPYAQPRMEDEPKLDFDQDINFSLVYDVLPKISISQWKGLEAEIPQVKVAEADIERELEELRERNAFVLDQAEDALAQNGDVATVNYCEIGENGEELPNTRRDDFAFTLGSGANVYKFDDDIIGMKKGDTKEISKTYPNDESVNSLLAGRTLKLKITLTALKEKKLPDLDDELAQDIDDKFKNLDDLKRNIRERLEANIERRLKDHKVSRVLEKIMEKTPVSLPESMVNAEIQGRMRNLARQFGADAEKLKQLLSISGGGLDDIDGKWRPAAEKALHSRLIVETLIEEQHIEAGDAELGQEIERIAAESNMPLEEAQKRYGDENMREYLKADIRERKFFDMLLAENSIKTGTMINYLDFISKSD